MPFCEDQGFRRYSDLMWDLAYNAIQMGINAHSHLVDSPIDFDPEIWIRTEGGHPWGTKRSWIFAEGREDIDPIRTKLDVVNVSNRKDYIVVAVNEGDGEIPVPIGQYQPDCTDL
jgi:hypothetical protein